MSDTSAFRASAGPSPTDRSSAGTASQVEWADPTRGALCAQWLASLASTHGLLPQTLCLASADASFRRYLRVDSSTMPEGSCIVMDAPPDREDCRPFVQVAALMAEAGLRVPRVLAWDEGAGFMLLSDLGTQTMLQAMDRGNPLANLPRYLQAIEDLVRWQKTSRPGVLPDYDAPLLRRELELFPQWYLQQHRGATLDATMRQTLDAVFTRIVQHNLASPSVYVHRDFMPRNLMVPANGAGQLGVLDFQDAVHGPITYDIACLMRDAFLSWEEEFVLEVTIRYWERARAAGLPVPADFGAFYQAVEWMGLQRHLKVAGIFARLTLRDGKPQYLADAPRFINYIRATASRYIELKPLLRLVDAVEGIAEPTGYAFGRV